MNNIKAKTAKDKFRQETIVIAGSARLPENVAAKHVYGFVTMELEMDPISSKIVDVSCVILPALGEKIIHQALLGNTVEEGIQGAIKALERRFYSATKRAVIAALEDAYKWYKKYLEEKKD